MERVICASSRRCPCDGGGTAEAFGKGESGDAGVDVDGFCFCRVSSSSSLFVRDMNDVISIFC